MLKYAPQMRGLQQLAKDTAKLSTSAAVVVCHPLTGYCGVYCQLLARAGFTVYVCASYPRFSTSSSSFARQVSLARSRNIRLFTDDEFHPELQYSRLYKSLMRSHCRYKMIFLCDYYGSFLRWLWLNYPPDNSAYPINGVSSVQIQSFKIFKDYYNQSAASGHNKLMMSCLPDYLLPRDSYDFSGGAAVSQVMKRWLSKWCPPQLARPAQARVVVVGYDEDGRAITQALVKQGHQVMVADSCANSLVRACYDGHAVVSMNHMTRGLNHVVWTYPHLDGFQDWLAELPDGVVVHNCSGLSLDHCFTHQWMYKPVHDDTWTTLEFNDGEQSRLFYVRSCPPFGDPVMTSVLMADLVYYYEWVHIQKLMICREHYLEDKAKMSRTTLNPMTISMQHQYKLMQDFLESYNEELSYLSWKEADRLDDHDMYTPSIYRSYGLNRLIDYL